MFDVFDYKEVLFQCKSIHRYYKALRSDQFNVIEPSVGREAFNWLHQFRNMYVACDSWYEVSCRDYIEYWDCPGDLLLDWKDKGYKTVFDLLQVSSEIANF